MPVVHFDKILLIRVSFATEKSKTCTSTSSVELSRIRVL